jgi:hypothetical protein
MFVVCIIGFQLLHDILFYLTIIQPAEPGSNQMIDVFKSYAAENGAKILVADAAMLIASAAVVSALKGLAFHYTVSVALVTVYAMTYTFYAKRA